MKRQYQRIIEVAEAYEVIVTIEVHGYFTTKPELMAEMQAFSPSPYLRLNMDTGNTFIAGNDPVKFLKRFLKRVSHVHVKDVSESLAAALRGKDTGIAVSTCALGEGVNAGNIRRCLALLRDRGYDGVLSIECEGQGGPMIEKSLAWLRGTLKELGIRETK
jgi:sugar phosphate isomerase/epimerase